MEIAGLSTAMSMADTANQFSVAVMSKSLDTMETMGEGMVQMLEQSVQPNLGQNIDVSI